MTTTRQSHCPTTRTPLNHHDSSSLSSSSSSCHSSTSTKSRSSSSISSGNSSSSSSLYISRDNNNNNNNNNNSNNNNQAKPTAKATLTEETTWRLRLSLNGVPTQKGRKVGELLYVDVTFLQEDGYEPPQGTIQQIIKSSNQQQQQQQQRQQGNDDAKTTYLKINRGRWQLSEDPEDRKDGLWIWGLFKEPLYPFMLLQIETEEYAIPGSSDGDVIQPLTLYAQINHRRDKNTGQVELDAAPLNLREYESIKADPFGAAKVDIYEEVKCGQLSLRPLSLDSSLSSSPSSSLSMSSKSDVNRNATL